jgi:hypothetical protein
LEIVGSALAGVRGQSPREGERQRARFGVVYWFEPGTYLVTYWFEPVTYLVTYWFEPVTYLVTYWFEPVTYLVTGWWLVNSSRI